MPLNCGSYHSVFSTFDVGIFTSSFEKWKYCVLHENAAKIPAAFLAEKGEKGI